MRVYSVEDFAKNLGNIKFISSNTHDGIVKISRIWGTFALLNSCFKYNDRKTSVPYAWEFSIGETFYIGRTIEEFKEVIESLSVSLDLGPNRQVIIYSANIAYDFHSYFEGNFPIDNLFAKETQQPLFFETMGFMFKDFNALVGERAIDDCFYTTEIITENSEIRIDEKNILINVIDTINERIYEELKIYKNVSRIPLTNTGRARRELKKLLKSKEYAALISSLTIEPGEMDLLTKAFTGGLVIAKEEYKGEVLENVGSWDLTSSYLASACSHPLPMSKGMLTRIKSVSELHELEKKYLWVGYVKLTGLINRFPMAILSVKQCYNVVNPYFINGKIAGADELIIPVTSADFSMIEKFYRFKTITFGKIYRYYKGYLPKEYMECVLGFYKDKTELKGTGREIEYTVKKSLLNASCFGIMVQNPIKDNVYFKNNKWFKETLTLEEHCKNYNTNKSRFTFYPWGVFISAYSRMHLLNAIIDTWAHSRSSKSMYGDFVYSDTDSVKLLNNEDHVSYFERYNKWISERICSVCKFYNIDKSLTMPKNNKGEVKPLGVWEYEGNYPVFETVGEKRYITINSDGEFETTISGVNSKKTSEYFENLDNVFERFSDEYFVIPKEHTGRMNVYLIQTERNGIIIDRDGEEHAFYAKKGVYQEPGEYSMTLTDIINRMDVERRTL